MNPLQEGSGGRAGFSPVKLKKKDKKTKNWDLSTKTTGVDAIQLGVVCPPSKKVEQSNAGKKDGVFPGAPPDPAGDAKKHARKKNAGVSVWKRRNPPDRPATWCWGNSEKRATNGGAEEGDCVKKTQGVEVNAGNTNW